MKEVKVEFSAWIITMMIVIIIWFSIIASNITNTNTKLDTLIKLQQQVIMYNGK